MTPPAIPFAHPFQDRDMSDISTLLEVMALLRDPVNGCPWDVKQSFATIAPYTVEEAYEVADAIAREDTDDLKEELGDLLLQVVYHAQMANEDGAFAFGEVVNAITAKLVRRHPHVFGDEEVRSATEVKGLWEKVKAEERAAKAAPEHDSVIDGVPGGIAAVAQAEKLQSKAAKHGFDWEKTNDVNAKIREELDELETEIERQSGPERLEDEVGDLLFAVVNLARHLEVDPDMALRRANLKFSRRFRAMEAELTRGGKALSAHSLDEMEAAWQRAKKQSG